MSQLTRVYGLATTFTTLTKDLLRNNRSLPLLLLYIITEYTVGLYWCDMTEICPQCERGLASTNTTAIRRRKTKHTCNVTISAATSYSYV